MLFVEGVNCVRAQCMALTSRRHIYIYIYIHKVVSATACSRMARRSCLAPKGRRSRKLGDTKNPASEEPIETEHPVT